MTFGAASVDAKSLGVGDLLNQRHPFWVPKYQRAYAWPDDSVGDFVRDLQRVLAGASGAVGHFFGGVVCIQHTDNAKTRPLSYEVVDGQQRLATLVLALSCLAEVADDLSARAARSSSSGAGLVNRRAGVLADELRNKFLTWVEVDVQAGVTHVRPTLALSKADDQAFQLLIKGQIPTPTRESHELLIQARATLLECIRDFVGSTGPLASRADRLVRVRDALVTDSHVIHIVSEDRQQAYKLFSVLNDRGESLSDADLLRSRSLELLEGFDAEQDAAAAIWDEILGQPAKLVDAFFRALYPSVTGRRASSDLFEQSALLYLPASAPTTAAGAVQLRQRVEWFRDELQIYAGLIAGVWPYDRAPGVQTAVKAWQVDRLKRLVLTLKHELALPVLLAAARSVGEKSFAELVYMLEIFAFRYKSICNGHATPPSLAYYKCAAAMRGAPAATFSFNVLRGELRQLLATSAGDARFIQLLSEKLQYSNSTQQKANIREFLTTLEDHDQWLKSQPVATARPKPSMNKVCDLSEATIEHVYPQNAKPADKDAALEPLKHLLGNLSFFGPGDNVAAANNPFSVKRVNNYPNSSITMTKDLAQLAAWDVAAIKTREAALVAAALRVFVL